MIDNKNECNDIITPTNPIYHAEISDKQLQKTILNSKFDLEKAKQRIDSLYTLRTLVPEFFGNYNPLNDDITQLHKSM